MKIAIPLGPEDTQFKLNKAYIEYIDQAGYEPIPAVPQNVALELAKSCDGLLLPGGKDIDPIYYDESNWGSFWADSEKDDFERQLLWAFINYSKPVFGICRGFQLIAREYLKHMASEKVTPASDETVADRLIFGQDIGAHDGPSGFHLLRSRPHHYVLAREDLLYGSENKAIQQLPVNSMHHQYLHANVESETLARTNKVTPHMRATAWTIRGLDTDETGVVCEGFILKGWVDSRIAGVQWHPEELRDYSLLHGFFGKSKNFRGPELVVAKAAI
jgi:gamma-glutamyl-gamma-aminobutyrate hydrolase PuuD